MCTTGPWLAKNPDSTNYTVGPAFGRTITIVVLAEHTEVVAVVELVLLCFARLHCAEILTLNRVVSNC